MCGDVSADRGVTIARVNDVPVRGRRMVVASRVEGGRRLPLEAVVEPEVVVASSPATGIGALVEAVVGGLHDRFSEMTRAMESLGSRPLVVDMPEAVTAALVAAGNQPDIIVNVPPQPAPVVNVTVPEQPAPQVTVNVPEQAAPVVQVDVAAPVVNVPETVVNVTVPAEEKEPPKRVTFKRDRMGEIVSAEIVEEG